MQPYLMSEMLDNLEFLKDQQWISATLIDAWLTTAWKTLEEPKAYYIPTSFIPSTGNLTQENISNEEIIKFRNLYTGTLPPIGMSCPLAPVVYVMNTDGNHFFTLVFAPTQGTIFIIGKQYNQDARMFKHTNWHPWQGKRVWPTVCKLMGWDHSNIGPIQLCSIDWKQNGYDCGPIACQVALRIMEHGIDMDMSSFWSAKQFPCCHLLRIKIAEAAHTLVLQANEAFHYLKSIYLARLSEKLDESPSSLKAGYRHLSKTIGPNPGSHLTPITRNLYTAMEKCPQCCASNQDVYERQQALLHPIPIHGKDPVVLAKEHKFKVLDGTYSQNQYIQGKSELDPEQETKEDHQVIINNGQEFRSNETPTNHTRPQSGWKEASIGRFPRPIPLDIPPPTSLLGLKPPFQSDFDDYTAGPSLTALEPIVNMVLQSQPSMVYLCNRMTISPWSLFKDYGYRLLPCFGHMFHLDVPIMVKQHLCTPGIQKPPSSLIQTQYPIGKTRRGDKINIPDVRTVGLQELLDLAIDEDSNNILLTGKIMETASQNPRHISLDLLRDNTPPDSLILSCDIDSIIWVTQHPRFKASISIYSNPIIRDMAPISKRNHVKVDLLFPQSEDDQMRIGGRTEWQTNSWSLSTLPHLLLGVVHQISSSVDLLLFFPRMAHRDPHRGFWINKIPPDVQGIFWDQVLLPALKAITPSTRKPYLPLNRDQSSFKQGRGRKGFKTGTVDIRPEALPNLIKHMKDLVCFQILTLISVN